MCRNYTLKKYYEPAELFANLKKFPIIELLLSTQYK